MVFVWIIWRNHTGAIEKFTNVNVRYHLQRVSDLKAPIRREFDQLSIFIRLSGIVSQDLCDFGNWEDTFNGFTQLVKRLKLIF